MTPIEQIRHLLVSRSQAAVARAIGVHPNTLYRIMRGKSPSYSTLMKLIRFFDIPRG